MFQTVKSFYVIFWFHYNFQTALQSETFSAASVKEERNQLDWSPQSQASLTVISERAQKEAGIPESSCENCYLFHIISLEINWDITGLCSLLL